MNRSLAQFFSAVGHPLFIIFYGLMLLVWLNPFAFGARHLTDQPIVVLVLMVLAQTVVIPGIAMLMLRPLGFIQSLEMEDKQERIIPYIIIGVFYLWLFWNLRNLSQAPPIFVQFVLGATIGLFLVFFFNIFTKISAHAAGMGGFVAASILTAAEWGGSAGTLPMLGGGSLSISINFLLAGFILLAGLVGVARLALGAHTPLDLYRGYLAGIFSQLLAAFLI